MLISTEVGILREIKRGRIEKFSKALGPLAEHHIIGNDVILILTQRQSIFILGLLWSGL